VCRCPLCADDGGIQQQHGRHDRRVRRRSFLRALRGRQ
jgi:hypothetical protein